MGRRYLDFGEGTSMEALHGWSSDRVHRYLMGISGGAMFTTVILTQRADTLASAVEFSGGADISVPLYENDFNTF